MERFQCAPFGIITVRRRHGAKNIRIRIEAEGLLVSADYYTSDKDIVKLIEENREAILTKQSELKSKSKLINEDFSISNKFFSLSVCVDENLTRYLFTLKADNNTMPYKFTMRCCKNIDFSDNDIQERMLNAINKIIKNIAKEPLKERTLEIASRLGFEVNSVRTKIEKSKWGSCSSNKNINLSAYLILLPDYLRDFIITHELCHLKEMNHSKRFHDLLNEYTGGREKELNKELKKYSINIFDYTVKTDA